MLIHIGLHKTASSLLQERLFCRKDHGFERPTRDRRLIHDAFVLPGPLELTPGDALDDLRRARDAATAAGRVLVISHERLSGYPSSGGFDRRSIASRLRAAFPDARILMVVREQRAMIASMYLQTVSDGSSLPIGRFLSPSEPRLLRMPGFRPDYLEYDSLLALYRELFGERNVLLLPFEQLKSDPATALARIYDHVHSERSHVAPFDPDLLRTHVNRSRPMAYQALRRYFNVATRNQISDSGLFEFETAKAEAIFRALRPVAEVLRPLDSWLKKRLAAKVAHFCEGRYGASNARLEAATGLQLAPLGYDVTAPSVRP
ncbi:sulfotransferase [Vannielia litorea]|uniref:sulfotransferase n=1 Tax=Vannielia litorea TaxID=1217970 RepID=UPI00111538C7|nr:sulfotransferase [Vannielia litorea]